MVAKKAAPKRAPKPKSMKNGETDEQACERVTEEWIESIKPDEVPDLADALYEIEPSEKDYSDAESSNLIENCIEGSQLHLGDGRVLAFGESAEVSGEVAAFLKERGQAK